MPDIESRERESGEKIELNEQSGSSQEGKGMDRTSFANGALHLLKWDRAEAYVRRFSTWRREEDISIR